MHGRISIARERVRQPVARKTESSCYNQPAQDGFVQLPLEAAVPVQMRRTNSAWLSTKMGNNNKRKTVLVSTEESAEPVLMVTAKRDDLLLWLNDYKRSKKTWNGLLKQ